MLWIWLLYASLIVGVLVWGAIIGLRFKDTLKLRPLPADLPLVSTIVPARNEERNIDRCVRGLARQNYPHLELIFVDDDSIDETPAILAQHAWSDSRIKVVSTQGKPDGWNGKQWACHSGAENATGDWLCFMDADTFAEPDLIVRTLAFATSDGIDMLTLQPWYELHSLWERIVLPAGLPPLLLVFPPHRVNKPDEGLCMANGQFILIRRDAYRKIGGHARIKDTMMDDYALAEQVKAAGLRLYVAEGINLMRVRLYTNLREIWAGALKAAVQISGGWLMSALAVLGNLFVNVLPVVALIVALIAHDWAGAAIMGFTVLVQTLYYGALRMAAFRLPPWSGITYPIGGIIVALILLDGMIRVATGQDIRWKGRSVLGRPDLPLRRTSDRAL